MDKKQFLDTYFSELKSLINFDEKEIDKIILTSEILIEASKKGKKTLIFGNGGSAAIASHFSVDITKNAGVRCVNFNEPDLLTCFSNDYGYEKWVEKSIEFYGDKDDIAIFISASGTSRNMLNGAKKAREKKFNKIITLSGNKINNELSKLGDINFWVNSEAYNLVENTHQIILLSLVDLIRGKSVYSPN